MSQKNLGPQSGKLPSLQNLPQSLPIFPLAGVMLLPQGRLPLNIFEPRYLAMTEDALAQGRLLGMVQPSAPSINNQPPPIYSVGCVGRIVTFSETDDGRFLLTLVGVCRFRVQEEIATTRGYRRIVPLWEEFAHDLIDEGGEPQLNRPRLLLALRHYFKANSINASWDSIENAPDEQLITSLCMVCPFGANEKQALIEAPTLAARGELLQTLLEMSNLHKNGDEPARH